MILLELMQLYTFFYKKHLISTQARVYYQIAEFLEFS